MERETSFELIPQPGKGCALPLSYSRSGERQSSGRTPARESPDGAPT